MRTLFTILTALFIIGIVLPPPQASAQAPQKMSYQAVIRNNSNTLITSAPIGMRISILRGSSNGTAVFVETQTSTTNANGLASIMIGSGTKVLGDFSTINWASGPYFIKTETDPAGGTNYSIVGTSELMSVPYALFSGNGTSSPSDSWTINGNNIFNKNTGNLGIGTNNPTAKLTIKTPINTTGWTHIGGGDSIIVTEGIGGVSAFIGTSSNHAFRLNAGGAGRLSIYPTGDVVVGSNATGAFGKFTVATPNNSYGISHLGNGGNILATYMGGTSAGIGTFSNTNMRIFANGISAIFVAAGTNNVGIGADFPTNKLQVGSVGTTGFATNDFAIGNGTNAMAIYQTDASTLIGSSTDIILKPRNNGLGYVGINTNVPANKLQIGSMGTTGFGGNDLAMGNGTNAMAIYQSNTSTLVSSTTDIILMPRNNEHGRVGINTSTPRAPLDVASVFSPNNPNSNPNGNPDFSGRYSYLRLTLTGSELIGGVHGIDVVPDVSIITDGRVLSSEFDAFSDSRIKDIIGISNSTKDLETINALKITDYTMKDKVKNGNKQFKKIIAQEVEKVYPQVVSKHTDFIPNVYQLTSKVEKTANGYLLNFTNKHNISNTAKKLQALLAEDKGMQQFEIVSLPSDNQVVINATDIKTNKVFVYGEEVDDFRTIDYEGLSTLNISATQELSKLEKKQQVMIENQQKQVDLLEKRLEALEAKR